MSAENYWFECIAEAASECGLTLSDDQVRFLAQAAEGAHDHYGQAFYRPESPYPAKTMQLLKSPATTLELRWAAGDDNIMLIERNRYCSGWHEQFVTLTPAQLRYAALMVGLEEDGRRDAPMLAQEEAERRAEGGDR